MKLAIVGSRSFPHLSLVTKYVMSLPKEYTVVSGGAIGVDRTAESAAKVRRMRVVSIRPDYKRFTWWAAPKERNSEIVRACDKLVAFWHEGSGGTHDVIEKAREAGKLWKIFYSDGREEVYGPGGGLVAPGA